MTTHTSGAADLPEALRPIHRFEVVDCIDSKHVPAVIPNPHGPWVRYEDHIAALAAGQAVAPAEPLHITHGPLMRHAAALLRSRKPVFPDHEDVAAELARAVDGHPTPSGAPSAEWLEVARIAEIEARPAPPAMDGGEDAEELPLLHALAFSVERAIGNGVMPMDIEEAYENYDKWSAARAAQKEGERP